MNRKLTPALVLVLGLAAMAGQDDKKELRYTFKKGEKFTFKLVHGLSVRLDKVPEILQGVVSEDPIDVKFEGVIDAEVAEVSENGTATVNGTWKTAKAKGHVMVNDIDFNYDAAKKVDEKPKKKEDEDPALQGFGDLQDQLAKMVKMPLKLSVDPLGKVSIAEGSGKLGEIESAFRSMNGLMGPLPKEKVGKGDTWKDEIKLGMPGVGGNVDIKIRTQNTIDAVEKVDGDDCLVVKSKFAVGKQPGDKDEAPADIQVKIKTDGEGEGKTYFSLSKSRALKSQSQLKVKVTATIPNPGGGNDEMELKAQLKIDSAHELREGK
ncbi:MAG: hypothetical protein JO332_13300 [Planctomycetaceae bacterium]|nr:hypothetical protein [Planctomycetaceae bacterium]